MIYYIQRLMTVVVMQGEVSTVSTVSTNDSKQVMMAPAHTTMNSASVEGGEGEELETRVEIDGRLLKTITKSTLLSVIGLLSSFWLHIEMFVKFIENNTDGALFRAIACVDGAVNVIVMYLIFAFARPYYEIGCKWCHIGMLKCCSCVTKKAVLRANESEV
eukprot:UN00120